MLWGYVKEKVYHRLPSTRENMIIKIREIVPTITPNILEGVKDSFSRRLRACILNLGDHIEHNM